MARSLGRPLWVSEYGDRDASGMRMARRIHDDITKMGVRAWVYWQLVDSASGWGFLYNPLTTNADGFTTQYVISKKFYVMGQFSKFIRPGCNIISVSDTNTLAAFNPSDEKLTLVTVNSSDASIKITYNLSRFETNDSHVAIYRTSVDENLCPLPEIPLVKGRLSSIIPAKSVTTFAISPANFQNSHSQEQIQEK